jgi:hypothetical protein
MPLRHLTLCTLYPEIHVSDQSGDTSCHTRNMLCLIPLFIHIYISHALLWGMAVVSQPE